jgi:hypothetical protein
MDPRTLRQDFPRVADSLHYVRPSGEISLRASLDSHAISPLVHNYRFCLYLASFGETEFDYFARNRTGAVTCGPAMADEASQSIRIKVAVRIDLN